MLSGTRSVSRLPAAVAGIAIGFVRLESEHFWIAPVELRSQCLANSRLGCKAALVCPSCPNTLTLSDLTRMGIGAELLCLCKQTTVELRISFTK